MRKISNLLVLISVMLITLTSCSGGGDTYLDKQMYGTEYIPAYCGSKAVYIDLSTGKKVKNYKEYKSADYFYDGIALVSTDEGYFFINDDFKPINKDKYVDATPFSEGIAFVVKKNGYIKAINKDGKEAFKLDKSVEYAYNFNDGVAVIEDGNSKIGLIDKKGKMLIKPEDIVRINETPRNGCIIVAKEFKTGEKWGVLDYNGNEIVPFEYEKIMYTFDDDKFTVKQENEDGETRWGIINSENEKIVPLRYGYPLKMTKNGMSGFANAYNGSIRCGFINDEGEEVIEPLYSDVFAFSMGLSSVCDPETSKWGYINEEGEMVIEPKFDEGAPFYPNGYAAVKNKETELFGVINKDGEYVIKSEYDDLFPLGDDLYIAKKSGSRYSKYGIINIDGEEVVQLSDIYYFNKVSLGNPTSRVRNDYVDVDGIVNSLIENLKQINDQDLSFASLSDAYNIENNYGWKYFSRVEKLGVSSYLGVFVDYEYDYNYTNRIYYGTALRFYYNIDDNDKAYKKKAEIFNKFASKLNSNTFMENGDFVNYGEEFTCPILNDITCKFEGDILYIKYGEKF